MDFNKDVIVYLIDEQNKIEIGEMSNIIYVAIVMTIFVSSYFIQIFWYQVASVTDKSRVLSNYRNQVGSFTKLFVIEGEICFSCFSIFYILSKQVE